MSLKHFISKNRSIVSGMGFVSLVPLTVSSAITAFLIQHQGDFQNLTADQWGLAFLVSTITMALAITPTTFIALVSGFFLGWQAVPAMIAAYLTASAIGFVIGKSLDNGKLLKSVPDASRFHQLVEEMKRQDWLLMIMVRISPVLPFSLINLLLPASGIRFRVFIIAGFIGMLPRTLFSIWVGLQAQNLIQLLQNPNSNTAATALMIVTAILSIGGLLFIFIRSTTRQINKNIH